MMKATTTACFYSLLVMFVIMTSGAWGQQLLPNSNTYIGFGFDSAIGWPPSAAFRTTPILPVTFNNGNTCLLPNGQGQNVNFSIPDGFQGCRESDYKSQSVQVQLYYSMSDVSQQMAKSQSFGGSVEKVGMYRSSSQASSFNSAQQQGDYSAYSYAATLNWLTGWPESTSFGSATSSFQSAAQNLPQVLSASTCNSFANFIQTYGTHVVVSAYFGGVVQMYTSFAESLTKNESSSSISHSISVQFVLKASKSLNNSQSSELDILNAQYTSTQTVVGGNASFTPGPGQDLQAWVASVPDNPLPMQLYVVELGQFISSAYPAQGGALSQAISQYLQPASGWYQVNTLSGGLLNFDLVALPQPLTAGFLYTAGGGGPNTLVSTIYAFNIAENSWSGIGNLAQGLQGVTLVPYQSGFFAFGGMTASGSGFSDTFSNVATLYTPNGASLLGVGTLPNLPYGFAYMGSAVLNVENYGDLVYLIAGLSWYGKTPIYPNPYSIWYQPSNKRYAQIANYPLFVWDHACAALQGQIYCCGGALASSTDWFCPNCVTQNTYSYDPATNRWTTLADLNIGRSGHVLIADESQGKLYAVGGMGLTADTNSVEVYDLSTGAWTISPLTLPSPVTQFGATVSDSVLWLVGGSTNGVFDLGVYQYLDITSPSCSNFP